MSTEILTIDEVTSAQADKFLTHNEALRQIEGQTIRVLSRTNSGPPVSPSNGDTYIVDVASGVWASATVLDIAHYYGAAWNFYTPVQGMRLHVNDENKVVLFDGVDWDSELLVSGAALTDGSVIFADSSGNLTEDNANLFWDDANNRLGIGTASPGVELDVAGGTVRASRADSTPAGTANTVFDDMIAGSTDTTNTGLTLFGSGQVGIAFGDAADNDIGQIRYQHSSNTMQIITNTTEALNFDSAQLATFSGIISVDDTTQSTSTTTGSIHTDGGLGVAKDVITGGLISTGGEASPDVDAGGICINHGANDGNALTLKNSDVAHGVTAYAETDTYLEIHKGSSAEGCAQINGYSEGAYAVRFWGIATTETAGDTGPAPVELNAAIKSGTTIAAVSSGNNILAVQNNNVTKVAIKYNGDIVTQGDLAARGGVVTLGTSAVSNGVINSPEGLYFNIDSDNNSTTEVFSFSTNRASTTGGTELFRIEEGGAISTGGETSPDVDAGGICINHGANDGNALTLKNSDVAHGMTTLAETDTYATMSKVLAADGGLSIKGFAEAKIGIKIESLVTTVNTSNTADGGMILNTGLKSGTTVTTLANGDNLLSVDNNDVVKVVVKGNGDVVTAGTFFAAAGVDVSAGGVITNGTIQTYNAAGPALLNEAALSANPTLVPNGADTNTGIGWPSADNLSVVCGGTEAAIFDSSLDLSIPNGGIKVGGGTDILDTYEEGTWTPELWDSTLATDPTPPTYVIQVGTYTRVGDLVHIQGTMNVSALGGLTTSDGAVIGGLPFTSDSATNNKAGFAIGNAESMAMPSAGQNITGLISNGVSYIVLRLWESTAGTTQLLVSEYSAGGEISFSATYKV